MKFFEFTIYYDLPRDCHNHQGNLSEAVLDAIYEAGCDDAMLARINNQEEAAFDREAETFADAVFSAMKDLKKVPHLQVTQVVAESEEDYHDANLINRTLELQAV